MKNVAIEVLNGPMDGYRIKKALSSDKPLTIGRLKEKDVNLPDDYVSHNHAEITCDDGRYWLQDYSRNGTDMDGEKIHKKKVELPAGTVFKVGNTLLKFEEISEREEIADQLCRLSYITEGITRSELKDLKEHPEIKEIEKRLEHAVSKNSDLKDLVVILKDLLETVHRNLGKQKPEVPAPEPPCPVATPKDFAELNKMSNQEVYQSIRQKLASSFGKFEANE